MPKKKVNKKNFCKLNLAQKNIFLPLWQNKQPKTNKQTMTDTLKSYVTTAATICPTVINKNLSMAFQNCICVEKRQRLKYKITLEMRTIVFCSHLNVNPLIVNSGIK